MEIKMKNSLNRVLALFLTAALVFGLCSFPVSASDTPEMSFVFTDTDFNELTGPALVGDTVYVGIKMDPYVPISSFGWRFEYNSDVLSFDSDENNDDEDGKFAAGVYSAAKYTEVNAKTAGTIITVGAHTNGGVVPATRVEKMGCFMYLRFLVVGVGDAACKFNTAGVGTYGGWSMTDENGDTVEVSRSNATISCVKPGVSLSAESAVADGTNDRTVSATAIGADGADITKTVTWAVTPASSDVSVGADGTITVDAKAKAAQYTVIAAGSADAFGQGVSNASATLTVQRNTPAAEEIKITSASLEVARPYYGQDPNSVTLSAAIYDQYGDAMSGTVTWSGDLPVSDDGVVTVSNAVKAGSYTVTATYAGDKGDMSADVTITVTEEQTLTVSSLALNKESDTIIAPASADASKATATYTVTAKDQYGRDMTPSVTWTWEPSEVPAGVSLEQEIDADGMHGIVDVSAGVGNHILTLTATSENGHSASVKIQIVDISVTISGDAVTVKDSPVYGDTWGEIVSINPENISVKLGEESRSGKFVLNVEDDATPDAGVQSFRVLYNDDAYQNVVVYEGSVDIAKANVTVPSAAVGLTYNGEKQIGVADSTLYTVESGAAKDAGEYKAVASLADSKNYQWADGTTADKTIDWSIAKVKVTATASVAADADLTYSGTAKDVASVNLTGDIAKADQSDVDTWYTVQYSDNVNAGVCTVTVVPAENLTNYTVTGVGTSFTITPAVIGADAIDASAVTVTKSYDGTVRAGTPNGSLIANGKNGETLSLGIASVSDYADATAGKGKTVTLTLGSLSDSQTGKASNYTLQSGLTAIVFAGAEITPAEYSYSVEDQQIKVGGGLQKLSAPATASGVGNETVSGTFDGWYTDAACSAKAADADLGKLSVGESIVLYWQFTTDNTNYTDAVKTGSITVTVIEGDPQNVSFAAAEVHKTYGDADFTMSATVTSTDATLDAAARTTYESSDTSVATVDGSGKVTVLKPGTTVITAKVAAVAGQYAAGSASYTLTVDQKELIPDVSQITVSKTYDGTTQTGTLSGAVSFTGKVGDDAVSVTAVAGEYADKNVGSGKTVTLSLSLAGDQKECYKLSVSSVQITAASITPSDSVSVTVSENQNSVVGVGSFSAPVFTGINESVEGTLTYTYGGEEMTKDAIEAKLKTLLKGATAEIGYTFVANGNYNKTINGSITVTMVDILFTVDGEEATAANAVQIQPNIVYGDAWENIVSIHKEIVASVNGEKIEGSYTLSVSGTPNAGAQSYEVLFTAQSGDKYQGVTVLCGEVTVQKKSVTVVWDETPLTYTGAEQAPAALAEGVNGAIELTVSGGATNAGTYTATASTKDANYTLENASLAYTIGPKSVTVAWDETTLTYTGAEQAPAASAEGVNGAIALTVSGGATNAGTYTATASTKDTNYTLDSTSLAYTIEPKRVTVVWDETPLTYTGVEQAPAASAEGVNGAIALTVSGGATNAGAYTATASTEDGNYTLESTSFAYSIAAKNIEVSLAQIGDQKFTGEALRPSVTLQVNGLVPGDTLVPDTDYTVSYAENVSVGKATVTVTDMAGGNYAFDTASVDFRIVKADAPVLKVVGATRYKFSASGERTLTIDGVPANAGTVTYTVGTVTDANDAIASTVTVTDGAVHFTLNGMSSFAAGVTVSIPVTVEMENYETAKVTVDLEIIDRDVPTVSAEDITVTYSGTALTESSIVGSASVDGTWSWAQDVDLSAMIGAGTHIANVLFTPRDQENYAEVTVTITVTVKPASVAVPTAASGLVYTGAEQVGVADSTLYTVEGGSAVNAGNYTALVTLKDATNYAWASDFDGKIAWTISKAMPTGTPSYQTIKSSGKTLAAAALAVGDITPSDGTICWVDDAGEVLAEDTEVKANTAYKWVYTPLDTDNYAELSGSVVLYKRTIYVPGGSSSTTGTSGTSGTTDYTLAIDKNIENGSVRVTPAAPAKGETVTVIVTPDAGYVVDTVTVTDKNGNPLTVSKNADGTYSFTMLVNQLNVSATFVRSDRSIFKDVHASDWFYDTVYNAYYKGLMKGVSADLFAPQSNLTRGMMMTVLARIAGADTDNCTPWYAKGMAWAVANGISDGTNPESDITREQAVTMLYRYMNEPKVDTNGLADFTDGTTTSDWAVDAMNWGISVGLIKGDTAGTIRPKDTASRAEVAALFVRFVENVLQ